MTEYDETQAWDAPTDTEVNAAILHTNGIANLITIVPDTSDVNAILGGEPYVKGSVDDAVVLWATRAPGDYPCERNRLAEKVFCGLTGAGLLVRGMVVVVGDVDDVVGLHAEKVVNTRHVRLLGNDHYYDGYPKYGYQPYRDDYPEEEYPR
jgi:hypothetical protein